MENVWFMLADVMELSFFARKHKEMYSVRFCFLLEGKKNINLINFIPCVTVYCSKLKWLKILLFNHIKQNNLLYEPVLGSWLFIEFLIENWIKKIKITWTSSDRQFLNIYVRLFLYFGELYWIKYYVYSLSAIKKMK